MIIGGRNDKEETEFHQGNEQEPFEFQNLDNLDDEEFK